MMSAPNVSGRERNMRLPTYKTVYLYLTHACNANCSYCYRQGFYERNNVWQGGCGPIKMSEQVARDAVEFCLNELPVDETVNFFFWGGEPFLNFKTMKYVVEKYPQFDYHTNTAGKPVTEEMAKRISVGVAQMRRYEKGSSSPTLKVIRILPKHLVYQQMS